MNASTSLCLYRNNFPTATTGSPRLLTVRGFILSCAATSSLVSRINARLPGHILDQQLHGRRDRLAPVFHPGHRVARNADPLGQLGLSQPHAPSNFPQLFSCHDTWCITPLMLSKQVFYRRIHLDCRSKNTLKSAITSPAVNVLFAL